MAGHLDLRHDIDLPFLCISHNLQDILLNAEAKWRSPVDFLVCPIILFDRANGESSCAANLRPSILLGYPDLNYGIPEHLSDARGENSFCGSPEGGCISCEFRGHDSHIQHGGRHLNRGVSSIRRQGTLQSKHTISLTDNGWDTLRSA